MAKTTGTCHKAKYAYKIKREDINDPAYVFMRMPKKIKCITKHAKKRIREKKLKVSPEQLKYNMIYRNLIELQVTDDGEVTFVFRYKATKEYDITFVINKHCRVVSVWANNHNDTHKTLDESIYRNDIDVRVIL